VKVIVVGGGAAGLMAAATAARQGHAVTVVERNDRPARKMMITGKGRCNVTNDCAVEDFIAHIPGNGRFLYSAATAFSPRDTQDLLEGLGLPLKVERGNRVFPTSDKAVDVVDAFVRYAKDGGVRFHKGRVVRLCIEDGVCTGVELEDGSRMEGYAVIVCTGGASYPQTGSTGDGYALARQAGHTVIPPRPSLVPLTVEGTDCPRMQGLSLRNVGLTAEDAASGKTVFHEQGELLFTHFGVSGPLILSASAHMRDMAPGRYRLRLDLKPALSAEQVDARLVRDFAATPNTDLSNALGRLLPRKMIPIAVERVGIPGDRKCRDITKEERRRLGEWLKDYPLTVTAFRPVEEAIVTAGGVSVKEIDARTMASRLVSGLYFAGEVLDVDGYTGGFNLQIAFSTGVAAGRSV
jgi:predicted Rossmann fold flavoprotein